MGNRQTTINETNNTNKTNETNETTMNTDKISLLTKDEFNITEQQFIDDENNHKNFLKELNYGISYYIGKISDKNTFKLALNESLNSYFNRNYKFKLDKNIKIKTIFDMNTLLSNIFIKLKIIFPTSLLNIELNEEYINGKIIIIKINSLNDPFIRLLQTLQFQNVESKIIVMERDNDFVFQPNQFMPTHCMAFIRDLIESVESDIFHTDQVKRNTYSCNFYSKLNLSVNTTYNYYANANTNTNVLYIGKLFNIFLNDLEIYDATTGLKFINETQIDDLIKITVDTINENNYNKYTGFEVVDKDFYAGDGKGSQKCNNFILYAKNKYCFMKYLTHAFASEGGFTFDHHHYYDPILLFCQKLPMYISSRTDLRGNTKFRRHYSTNVWYIYMLYYWLNIYGIKTTCLTNV